MKSKYNICKKIGKSGVLIFNTLYQNLFFVSKQDYADFVSENKANKNYSEWANEGLLGDNLENEYTNALIKLNNNAKTPRQIITLFVTTACNARCAYCFEKGIVPLTINKNKINTLSEAIIKSINCECLHITWFGGEPLLCPDIIDSLTKNIKSYCKQNNIKYTASIITNGSLINEQIAKKMHDEWNIVSSQITLDGCSKKYNKIKAYVDNSNFDQVINNIKLLTQYGHKATIRVNFDKYNIKDCLKLIKYLFNTGLTSDKIHLYFAPITTSLGNDKNKKQIARQFDKIFKTLYKFKYLKSLNYFNFRLAEHHCQAEQENSYCLFPNGKVSKCQRMRPENATISVCDKDFLQNLNKEWSKFAKSKHSQKCENCNLLPLCQGGCKIKNIDHLAKNHCDRCYVYSDAFDSILKIMSKIYLK